MWSRSIHPAAAGGATRRTLPILVFVPALFLLSYGYALSFDVGAADPGQRPQPLPAER